MPIRMSAAAFLLSLFTFFPIANAASTLPLDDFIALPTVSNPSLSPNGKFIVAETLIDDAASVVVMAYNSIEMQPVVQLKQGRDRIDSIRWLNNERLLVRTSFPVLNYGQRYRISRYYAVNIDGSNLRELDLPKLYQHEQADKFTTLSVINLLPDDPEHILVQAWTGKDPSPAVFKIDVNDSSVEKTVSASNEIDAWVSNRKGEVLFGIKREYEKSSQTTKVELFKRDSADSDKWESIYAYTAGEDFYMTPVMLSDDEKSLIVQTDYQLYRDALWRFDLEKHEFSDVVFSVEDYDLDDVIIRDGKLAGVLYTKDFTTVKYFDEGLQARQQMISKSFGQNKSYIFSSSNDSNRLIVSVTNAKSPVKFFLVDLATKQANFWLSMFPMLENKDLPAKQHFTYSAQDGMTLHGYFTPGSKGGKSPLIVLPHGGPRSRDTAHFDIFAQFLARRGYAVVQMNFRGSSGYGNKYQVSGYKEWGGLMQSDVYDAIDWVAENNMADTDNACMVGWSYGGYVALTAGFQKPDAFKCIVSVAGIADLEELIRKDSFYDEYKADVKRLIGDVDNAEELADIKQNSAINHVSAFKAPVLLVQGKNDTKVHYTQSEDFYEAMDDADKEVEYILIDEGTHNLDNKSNRIKAFKAIDKFIAEYLE